MKQISELKREMIALNDQMKVEKDEAKLREMEAQYKGLQREVGLVQMDIYEREHAVKAPEKSANQICREKLLNLQPGQQLIIPQTRESIAYNGNGGTGNYLQGVTVVEIIPSDRKDTDILAAAGVPMTLGVRGNKIQWAFAGGVEAELKNELDSGADRTIDLDAQTPIQQRIRVRVRISRQSLINTDFDLIGFINKCLMDAIMEKVNFAAGSTTKASATFYGGFAQDAEQGTYGEANYVPGKQTGTYTSFTKETAAEMVSKIAKRNLPLAGAVFVMGSEDFWAAKVTAKDAGSGIMLIGDDNKLLGVPVIECNAINRATQKGAIAGHNIGLGNFRYLPTMQHGDITLSLDNSSAVAADTDEIIATVNAYFSMTILKDAADAFVVYSKTNS